MNRQLLIDLRNALLDLPEDPKEAERLGFNVGIWEHCVYGVGTTLPSWQEAGLVLTPPIVPDIEYTPVKNARNILGLTIPQWHRVFYEPTKAVHDAHAAARRINRELNQVVVGRELKQV